MTLGPITKNLSDGGALGTCFGQNATDLISFYGATATGQPTSVAVAASTASVSVSATQWGYSTSTQASAIAVAINSLQSILHTLGLTS